MPIPTRTLDAITTRILAHFRTSFPGFPLGTKKFLGRLSRAAGLTIWGLQKSVEDVDKDIIPSPQSSTNALSDWATLLGLPDGGGGYGRLLPTTASGGLATLTGVEGTIYPNGILATAEDGTTEIALSGAVTIPGVPPGFGSVVGAFVASTAGIAGNLPVGTVCTWASPPAGADTTFTLTSPLSGGTDTEDNPSVYSRIRERLQTPPRGGTAEDFRIWARTVEGVAGVYVYPHRSGVGSVDIVVTVGGSGQGRVPSGALIADVQTAIDSLRPIGAAAATVLPPYAPTANGLLIRIRVVPSSSRYDFDWNDTVGGPFTVDTYTVATPAKLKLNTLAPISLKNAIDTYIAGNGLKPRLQVLSTGSVINTSVGCTAWIDVLGQTELTLENPLPNDWVTPTFGDVVYAYGPVVATIAAGELNFIDSLGPSRASGFGDPITPWIDTLTISGMIAVAENAVDSDGTELIAEVPVGGATIDAVSADVQGSDGINGPELLFASHIAITA